MAGSQLGEAQGRVEGQRLPGAGGRAHTPLAIIVRSPAVGLPVQGQSAGVEIAGGDLLELVAGAQGCGAGADGIAAVAFEDAYAQLSTAALAPARHTGGNGGLETAGADRDGWRRLPPC